MQYVSKSADRKNALVVRVALLLIVAYTLAYSIAFAVGPSHMGDDIAYSYLAYQASQGNFSQSMGDILSVRILHIFPIGFFYLIFGPGILSSVAWDMISFACSTVIVFLLGKELYGERAGLLAAFLLSVFPLAAIYSTTMSDNVPMMLFGSLTMYSLLLGTKRNSRKWYFISGAMAVATALTIPEGFILWVVMAAYLFVELFRRRLSLNKTTLFLAYGLVCALLALFAFNYINAKSPFITFTSNIAYYGETYRPDLLPQPLSISLSFYPGVMFPYGLTWTLYHYLTGGAINMGSLADNYLSGGNTVGIYFYVLLIAAAYLLLKKDKRSYFPFMWLVLGILYLEFGPQHVSLSPFTYVLSHRLDRYLLLIAPPLVLILSAALTMFVETSKRKWKKIKIALCVAAIAFIIMTSMQVILFVHEIAISERYPQLQAAKYLEGLPSSTRIYLDGGYGDTEVYMGFRNASRFYYGYGGISNCSGIPPGSYVLLPRYLPNTLDNCTAQWEKVLSPQLSGFPAQAATIASPDVTDLYFVPDH